MNRTGRRLAAGLLLSWTAIAAAGGTATVEALDGEGQVTVRLELLDAERLRLSSPQQSGAYLLMLGDALYNILDLGGSQLVLDALAAIAGAAGQIPVPSGTDDIRRLIALQDLNQPETIAGIPGRLHRLRYVDGDNRERDEDVVLTSDALIRDLSRAMYRLGTRMGEAAGLAPPEGSARLMAELETRGLGLLRLGTRMRITAVDRAPPPAGRFELPASSIPALPGFGDRP